jgi:hypothetical protein
MAEETNCQIKNKRWASDKVTAKLGTSLVFGFQQTQVQTQHVVFVSVSVLHTFVFEFTTIYRLW